jgi:hypothetical protein
MVDEKFVSKKIWKSYGKPHIIRNLTKIFIHNFNQKLSRKNRIPWVREVITITEQIMKPFGKGEFILSKENSTNVLII